MEALLAVIPVVAVVSLMTAAGWPAWKAGTVSAGVALVVGLTAFDLADATGGGPVAAVAATAAEASFTAATILWIIGPALAIHHLQVATGATGVLRDALGRLSDDPRVLALLIGWFFALFAEGAAGFGASVALAAPFLVGVGFEPIRAVTIAFVGHAVGVSFGAIGTPIIPQVAATGLPARQLSAANAVIHALIGWTLLVVLVRLAGRDSERSKRIWPLAALAAVAFLLPYWLLAWQVGPELPTLGGSLIGAAVFVMVLVVSRARDRGAPGFDQGRGDPPPEERGPRERAAARPDETSHEWSSYLAGIAPVSETETTIALGQHAPQQPGEPLWRAGAPYLVLVVLVGVTRLVPAIGDPLGAVEVAWTLPGGFGGSFQPLSHPGTLLVIAFLGGALLQRVAVDDARSAVGVTGRQLLPVTGALVAMLLLARTMVHAGMTEQLAESAAGLAGSVWPLVAPMVGMLGTFVTGSATASNVLFADLQAQTADVLGLGTAAMMGAQGFGAAVGNLVCPHNLVAASATVGLSGQEGDLLRRTLPVALAYVLAGGVLVWFLT